MSIIELNTSFFRESSPLKLSSSFFRMISMPSQDILNGCWDKQILLLEAQFFSSLGWIVRIKNTCDIFSSLSSLKSIIILTSVKSIEVEFIERKWFPKSQANGVESSVSWNWSIIGSCNNGLAILPVRSLNSLIINCFSHFAVEMNLVFNVDSFNLPRITIAEPIIWHLDLISFFDDLLKNTIIVSDSVAPCWNINRCEGI